MHIYNEGLKRADLVERKLAKLKRVLRKQKRRIKRIETLFTANLS